MRFPDYLWRLLSGPFKRSPDGDVRKWVEVLGEQLDEVKQRLFGMRRSWLIPTASGRALDLIGRSRKLYRYPGESDNMYRRRLSAAFEIYRRGGTIPGMVEALRLIGFPNANIHELYKDGPVSPFYDGTYLRNGIARRTGGVRWAEFRIRASLEEAKDFTVTDMAIFRDTIMRMKPARSMPTASAFDVELTDYVPFDDDAEIAVVFVERALRELWPWSGNRRNGVNVRNGVIRYDTKDDDAGIRLELEGFADMQQVLRVNRTGSFRRDNSIRYGHHPAMLDTGSTGGLLRLEDNGPELLDVDLQGGLDIQVTEQFPDGPTLHNGVLMRSGIRSYGQDRTQEEFAYEMALGTSEAVPGTVTRGSNHMFHDGGGPRWRRNGRISRQAYIIHDGSLPRDGRTTRMRSANRYGDKARLHDGLEGYAVIRRRDGSFTRGANRVIDEFAVVVKRHGRTIAA